MHKVAVAFFYTCAALYHLHGSCLHGNRVGLGGQSSSFILAARPLRFRPTGHSRASAIARFPTKTGRLGSCFHRSELVWGGAAAVFFCGHQ